MSPSVRIVFVLTLSAGCAISGCEKKKRAGRAGRSGASRTYPEAPVPWPARVRPEDVVDHRLTSFPDKLGKDGPGWRYVLAQDGELSADGRRDGQPDGIIEMQDEALEILGIKQHELNWYYSALYRDTRAQDAGDGGGSRYVQMHVTYHTGALDAVPHVPEACLPAAGARVIADKSGSMPISVPQAPPAWREFNVRRTAYEAPNSGTQAAVYHFFSVNGRPTANRYIVRYELASPRAKYCYFAQVQITAFTSEASRLGIEPDLGKCDQACKDFLASAVPEILRFLPSAEDVERLDSSARRE